MSTASHSMTDIAIREATLADLKPFTELAYKTFWDAFHDHPKNAPNDLDDYMSWAFSEEQMSKEFSDPNSVFLLAEIDDDLAGYAKLIFESTEPDIIAEWPVELSRLYSHQKFLGKGVGQALMDACFARARETGRDVIWLGVWEYNPRAQRFYEKNGFRYVGKHTFLLGSDPQTDLLMQKEV
jgi:GNAT superfamily N-acetyltransferase